MTIIMNPYDDMDVRVNLVKNCMRFCDNMPIHAWWNVLEWKMRVFKIWILKLLIMMKDDLGLYIHVFTSRPTQMFILHNSLSSLCSANVYQSEKIHKSYIMID